VFKALGLSALVLGLMALAASSAQAEAGAKWTVGGTDAGTLKASVQLGALTGTGKAVLSTKIGGTSVKFLTTATPELIGVKLEGEGKLTTGGKVKFTGVHTELGNSGTASGPCKPLGTAEADATLGIITSAAGKGELVLHENAATKVKSGVTKIQPESGTVFGKLFFGAECSLPEEVPVITKAGGNGLVLTDPLGVGNELVTHEITELAALTELWTISVTEEHKATVTGSASVVLTSPHNALKWKGTPG
jgi:hypothetical protein